MPTETQFTPLAEKVGKWGGALFIFGMGLFSVCLVFDSLEIKINPKKLNNDYGTLLTAAIAFLALFITYREYKIRNAPTFYFGVDSHDFDENELIRFFFIYNTSGKVITVESEEISLPKGAEPISRNRSLTVLPNTKGSFLTLKFSGKDLEIRKKKIPIRCRVYSGSDSSAVTDLEAEFDFGLSLSPYSDGRSRQRLYTRIFP